MRWSTVPAADCDRFLSLIKAGAFSPIFRKLILRLNVAKSSSSLYINPNYRIVTIIWSDTVYNMMIEELSFLLLTKFRFHMRHFKSLLRIRYLWDESRALEQQDKTFIFWLTVESAHTFTFKFRFRKQWEVES